MRVTGGKERIRHYVEVWQTRRQGARALAHIAELHAAKNSIYAEFIAAASRCRDLGIVRLIEDARGQGLRIAIATTTSPDNVDALLHASFGANSASWFEVVGAGDVVP